MITFMSILMVHIVISMRLPDSLLKIWAMIKGLEQIKDSVESKYFNFFGLNFMFPGYNIYQAVTSPDWDGDMNVCIVIKGRLYCQVCSEFALC